MSHIWTFSPSSEAKLEKCIAASLPPDENNKWFRAFCRKRDENDQPKDNLSVNMQESYDSTEDNSKINLNETYQELIEIIENELVTRFEEIVEICNKDQNLFTYLPQRLLPVSIEKICKQVLTTDFEIFLINFYSIFIPNVIKKEYNRYMQEFLIQSRKKHQQYLDILLDILIKDTTLPNNVVHDYVLVLNENQQLDFLKKILEMDLNGESFLHNLSNINIVYKNCLKSHELQKLLFTNLSQNAEYCKNDRQFGRLLLSFLQNEKSGDRSCLKKITEIVNIHTSPFKRPCEVLLNEIEIN